MPVTRQAGRGSAAPDTAQRLRAGAKAILPRVAGRPDIAIVSLGTTPGWRLIDAALADQIRAAGASCRVVRVTMGPAGHLRRAMALTDVVESLAAVHAADGVKAGATIFSTVTAALLQPLRRPHAIQFDTTAS